MNLTSSSKLKQRGLLIWEATFILAFAAGGAVYLIYKTITSTNTLTSATNQPFQNIPQQRTGTFLGQ